VSRQQSTNSAGRSQSGPGTALGTLTASPAASANRTRPWAALHMHVVNPPQTEPLLPSHPSPTQNLG
ncbi:hypothetical protein CPAR01_03843, partial [Colletotrichum paranaense]